VAGVQEALPGLDDLLPEPAQVVEPDGGLLELLPGAGGWAGGHDLLWSVVGSHRVEGSTDVHRALDVVGRRLAALLPGELVTFDRQLREVLHLLDVDALRALPVRVRGLTIPLTEEGFHDARCACVLAGREAVALALADERAFRPFLMCVDGGLLEGLAHRAHEARTGRRLP
jgi:hypothetical protein